MNETNLFNTMKSKNVSSGTNSDSSNFNHAVDEFNQACKYTITNFKYVPEDDEVDGDWVVDRVEMSVEGLGQYEMYLYSGDFFTVKSGADERDIFDYGCSKDFVISMFKKGEYRAAIDYLINLHIHLAFKCFVVSHKVHSNIRALQQMLHSVFSDIRIYKTAQFAYMKLINNEFVSSEFKCSSEDLVLPSKLYTDISCHNKMVSYSLQPTLESDIKIWGDMYRLNDAYALEINSDEQHKHFNISLKLGNIVLKSKSVSLQKFEQLSLECKHAILLDLLFDIFSKESFTLECYNVQGLLYDKHILTNKKSRCSTLLGIIVEDLQNMFVS